MGLKRRVQGESSKSFFIMDDRVCSDKLFSEQRGLWGWQRVIHIFIRWDWETARSSAKRSLRYDDKSKSQIHMLIVFCGIISKHQIHFLPPPQRGIREFLRGTLKIIVRLVRNTPCSQCRMKAWLLSSCTWKFLSSVPKLGLKPSGLIPPDEKPHAGDSKNNISCITSDINTSWVHKLLCSNKTKYSAYTLW